MIKTKAKANCRTVIYPPTPPLLLFRGYEPGAFSVKNGKNIKESNY